MNNLSFDPYQESKNPKEEGARPQQLDQTGQTGQFQTSVERDLINVMIKKISEQPGIYLNLPDKFKDDKEFVLAFVKNFKGLSLNFLNDKFKNDKDVILAEVEKDGLNLEWASPSMKGDKDIALAALKQNPDAWKFVNKNILRDKKVLLQAIIKPEFRDELDKGVPNERRKRKYTPFNQAKIVELHSREDSSDNKDLHKLVKKYKGLCELVCNLVLKEDLLKTTFNLKGLETNRLPQAITSDSLGDKKIVKSHLLERASIWRKIGAILFSIYPKNIFSFTEQRGLVEKRSLDVNKEAASFIEKNKGKINLNTYNEIKELLKEKEPSHLVNRTILFTGLDRLENGQILKLLVFRKFPLTGHSLLVKKTDHDDYVFFDPNTGIEKGLSKEELALEIDGQLKQWSGTDIFFMPAEEHLKEITSKV